MSTVAAALDLKEIAKDFLRRAATGDVREAYRLYVAPNFRHHNAYFKGDADSLRRAMEENAAQFPEKALVIHHVLAEGDLVAIHGHVRLKPQDRGLALFHLFRFAGDKIVELWDMGQEVPEGSPNENGMF